MTRQELFDAMCHGEQVTLHHTVPDMNNFLDSEGNALCIRHCTTIGRIMSMELVHKKVADGGGYDFNVRVETTAGYGERVVFVHCDRPSNVRTNANTAHLKVDKKEDVASCLASYKTFIIYQTPARRD